MDFFLGTICPWAINFVPRDWMSCEGQLLPIAQYNALFALLGTNYGGNGTSTFALPDLRGRAIVGQGAMPGGSTYQLGKVGGANSVTLTTNNLPSHTHPAVLNANQLTSDSNDPASNYLGGGVSTNYTASAPDVSMNINAAKTANMGGGQPVGIQNPYLVTYYNICVQGLFPVRG